MPPRHNAKMLALYRGSTVPYLYLVKVDTIHKPPACIPTSSVMIVQNKLEEVENAKLSGFLIETRILFYD